MHQVHGMQDLTIIYMLNFESSQILRQVIIEIDKQATTGVEATVVYQSNKHWIP